MNTFFRQPFFGTNFSKDAAFASGNFFHADSNANFNAGFNTGFEAKTAWTPAFELRETKTSYFFTMELAGVAKENVFVEFANNFLIVRGEKKCFFDKKEGEMVQYNDRFYGTFYRNIPFAEAVDFNKIEASFKDGLLFMTIPKFPSDKANFRSISIN